MNSNVQYCVKLQGRIAMPFASTVGLKQGCVLSSLLSNLYMSHFPDKFDSTCDPVILKDSNLSCLLFADDVVLMSGSSEGLASYCNKWNLTINTSKTKIIIWNKDGHKISCFNFVLSDTEIDVVRDYTYLGRSCFPEVLSPRRVMPSMTKPSMLSSNYDNWILETMFLCHWNYLTP